MTSPFLESSFLLEVCVDSACGFLAAAENGADRIELCAALSDGGLTPSAGFMRLAAIGSFPTRVMIRPRAGDFTYSTHELDIMLHDIDTVDVCGLEGVVLGANLASGALDEKTLSRLTRHAKALDLKVTLHRSFDLAPYPLDALEVAIGLQIDTILTSGGETTATDGAPLIATLVTAAQLNSDSPRIEIMAGSGVRPDTVMDIVAVSNVRALHASCSSSIKSQASKISTLGFVHAAQRDTDPRVVARMRHILNAMSEIAA